MDFHEPEPETVQVEAAMQEASSQMEDSERTDRMAEAFRLSNAAMMQVRWCYNTLCGVNEHGLAAPPPEVAQWHLIQVHMRALSAWRGE